MPHDCVFENESFLLIFVVSVAAAGRYIEFICPLIILEKPVVDQCS